MADDFKERYKVNGFTEISDNEQMNSIKAKREQIYTSFVNGQEKGFLDCINYINSIIELLKQRAKISPYIEIRARIKDSESAIINHIKNKALDDVFGVEIICATEQEIAIIKEEIEKHFRSTKTREHNKANGYRAIHESYSVRADNGNLDEYEARITRRKNTCSRMPI